MKLLEPVGVEDLTELPDFVWREVARVTDQAEDAPLPADAHAVSAAILELLNADNLPILYYPDEDPEYADCAMEDINELSDPSLAAGSCGVVSDHVVEVIEHAIRHRPHGDAIDLIKEIVAVQGMSAPALGCNHHYALLVRLVGGTAFVLDLTFSQFDAYAPFPLVATPGEWVSRINVCVGAAPAPALTAEEFRLRVNDRYPGVVLHLEQRVDIVEVSHISVPGHQRRGAIGTQVMRWLAQEADLRGWTLALTPDSTFGTPVPVQQRWYHDLGYRSRPRSETRTRERLVRKPEVRR